MSMTPTYVHWYDSMSTCVSDRNIENVNRILLVVWLSIIVFKKRVLSESSIHHRCMSKKFECVCSTEMRVALYKDLMYI